MSFRATIQIDNIESIFEHNFDIRYETQVVRQLTAPKEQPTVRHSTRISIAKN